MTMRKIINEAENAVIRRGGKNLLEVVANNKYGQFFL